ncbi:hypothetical protein KKA50_03175 [Patescibacteria group bacterium]|nr:hypothetical protein [Patescibacteria group bacterium]
MEENKRHDFLIGLCITLGTIIIGLISYVVYFNTISQQKARCDYSGWSYANGDQFKSSDGCNSCACSDGQVVCTEMACTNN